ncbi:Aspartyl-tRNA(Asn) amidotransferase subunit B / Glutamyl-tRNA(Gln) amidotransferase subunit B [Methanosarcina lacustris Z-7289]|uniref:Aspartyl/glutamyl-tRNA(Asn/Gln) amidotransferase subunit B n=1 Tax=Methanosarcina lacustris Z-7289 TaxID=1434111 RepID=A0A0E3RYT4_9EURY|nr:Asp-tRNA(Asn)/Glu-tRNA(Gln) amidotransferase subunit GatB [Methanosarcina lacustris]AKB73399.1 Aspartyl-tRNA(Asn) amidotransferase subunit B / Glutamyl-tRNA(Gln) amidotransferase subunit B [Methanosarcina lacustris Z-7289]
MAYENPDGIRIGLEIHVQLNKLKTKMFCGCSTDYHNAAPNTHTCPICLGLPGTLPVLNKKAVEAAIKVGLALEGEIAEETQFHRKNYFYPDLPKGFQVTQFDFPIVGKGKVVIEGEDGEHVVGITRAHMEEDPGKLVHIGSIEKSKGVLIDYNRSGMSLIETVTDPDMRSPKEARRFLDKFRNILEYLDVFDGNLEGAMRVDANVSVYWGTRVEIKNISSHKGVERALLYEIMRQKNVIRRGGKILLETRHFDEGRGVTISMRTKEEAEDYRYFREPDLMPMRVTSWIPAIKETLPELPDAKRARFMEQYGITDMHAKSLTSKIMLADFYEGVCATGMDPKTAATWTADVFLGELNYRDLAISSYDGMTIGFIHAKDPEIENSFKVPDMVELVTLFAEGKVSDRSAVEVIRAILDGTEEKTPSQIIEEKGLFKAEDDLVTRAVAETISENAAAVQDYLGGAEKSLNFLVGQVMKKTKGTADAKTARELIVKELKG